MKTEFWKALNKNIFSVGLLAKTIMTRDCRRGLDSRLSLFIFCILLRYSDRQTAMKIEDVYCLTYDLTDTSSHGSSIVV